ncbi:MAG: hypothetical protein ACKOX6_12110 [Bdellovibrio sp.]
MSQPTKPTVNSVIKLIHDKIRSFGFSPYKEKNEDIYNAVAVVLETYILTGDDPSETVEDLILIGPNGNGGNQIVYNI